MGRALAALCLTLVFLGAFAGASSVTTQPAWAQTVIRDIRVEGNRRVEPETVRSYLRFTIGDRYDEFEVDQSLKALFATGLFADVSIRRSSTTVVVFVVENPIINRVVFEGNSEIDDKTLETEVQLKSRSVLTRARVQADVQRILDVYSRQGMFTAQVNPVIIELDQNRVDLVFEISEGPETKVQNIAFVGNRAFTDGQLRDVITTSETGLLSFLKPTNIYDPDRLRLDRELLRQFYLTNGYADARVIAATADLDRSGNGFFITFTIDEGEIYTFGDVSIATSLTEIDTVALQAAVTSDIGDKYDASAVEKTVEKLTLMVAEQGYAFAQVRPRADRDPISRTIAIAYHIEQGPRVYIERINIIGNVRTRDYVIRREFRLAEGDAYNRLLVDRARKRLQGLGFFSKVEITREPGGAPDRVILNVNLQEQSTGEISFGGGFSSSEGVIGDIALSERNLMGRGQFIRLKLAGSAERLQIDLAFTEPRFLDRNMSAGFDVFHKEVDLTTESSFRSRKSGGGLRLGFPLAESVWMNTRYTFVRDEVYDVDANASQAVKDAAGVSNVSSVGYSITYDGRNHASKPTEGFYLAFEQDLAGVGGDVFYIRSQIEGRAYYSFAKGWTLVGRAVGGHIAGWNGEDVRLIDAFYKGGETVRGFERAGYGPRDAITDDGLGGTMFYAVTAELRFPFPLIPEELGISGALFADAGSLWDIPAVDLNTTTVVGEDHALRASVGASLLWDSPLGPLRADFAYILTSEDHDKEQEFRFGATTRF
ncbi:MAG: outer membrane protein assembly factor BamA [Rhizobiales bacterium]|nr:outer membrane protein assembly factor BamA [Hyphomicrobiales bacterium]